MAKQSKRSATTAATLGTPIFAQPAPTADPTKFVVTHPSDGPAYSEIDKLNREHKLLPMPFPAPRDLPEPQLTLAEVLDRPAADAPITAAGQIVFHAVGDTGNTSGPTSQSQVADKMVSDFDETDAAQVPIFCCIWAT